MGDFDRDLELEENGGNLPIIGVILTIKFSNLVKYSVLGSKGRVILRVLFGNRGVRGDHRCHA